MSTLRKKLGSVDVWLSHHQKGQWILFVVLIFVATMKIFRPGPVDETWYFCFIPFSWAILLIQMWYASGRNRQRFVAELLYGGVKEVFCAGSIFWPIGLLLYNFCGGKNRDYAVEEYVGKIVGHTTRYSDYGAVVYVWSRDPCDHEWESAKWMVQSEVEEVDLALLSMVAALKHWWWFCWRLCRIEARELPLSDRIRIFSHHLSLATIGTLAIIASSAKMYGDEQLTVFVPIEATSQTTFRWRQIFPNGDRFRLYWRPDGTLYSIGWENFHKEPSGANFYTLDARRQNSTFSVRPGITIARHRNDRELMVLHSTDLPVAAKKPATNSTEIDAWQNFGEQHQWGAGLTAQVTGPYNNLKVAVGPYVRWKASKDFTLSLQAFCVPRKPPRWEARAFVSF